MRAIEFLGENATAGATSSGNVATVAMPQQTKDKTTFFGTPLEDAPKYGSTKPIVLRRSNPLTKENKKD